MSDNAASINFELLGTRTERGAVLRVDVQLKRCLRNVETLTLVTKETLLKLHNLGRRRVESVEAMLQSYDTSLLPSIEAFPGRFLDLYGPIVSEDTPIESIGLMTSPRYTIEIRSPSTRTVRDAHAMMRERTGEFYRLAQSVGIKPAEGPLCQNGLFVYDKRQKQWDILDRNDTQSIYQ